MRNRRIPGWIALLLAAVLLCAVLFAFLLLPWRPRPPPPHVIRATQDFELPNGESISLRSFSLTAAGGFHGYKRGGDQTRDMLVFVRDGSSKSENAQVIVWRSPGTGADVFASSPGSVRTDEPPQRWTANGIDFICYTFKGEGENVGYRHAFVHTIFGGDVVTFDLESPASMWPEAFAGLAELVATVRPTEKGR
jgi:hypothetical protein